MGSEHRDCTFCQLTETLPGNVVVAAERWVLAHIHDLFPEGTLVLYPREHGLISEVTAEHWAEAAPLLALGPRLLTEVGGAERVYVVSFSESYYHFHFVMFPKRPELPAAHSGKVALGLLSELVAPRTHDRAIVNDWVARYRAYARSA